MSKLKFLLASLLLPAALFAVPPVEKKMPIQMSDFATRFKKNCPSHVKISAEQNELVISLSSSERKGGFDGTHAMNLKPLAGRVVTIVIDVKAEGLKNSDGTPSGSVGRIVFGTANQHLAANRTGWYPCTFKSVKIPGSGMLKMRIVLRNVSGEIRIRNPRMRGDLPKAPKKKKSKKSKKN